MRKSRQRDAILKVLHSTKSHPEADAIYEEVRKTIPNISLGTVYRNLSALTESGEILKLDTGLGAGHYDGDPKPHDHFVCRECGRVFDVDNEYDAKADEKAGADLNCEILYHTLMFYGICNDCANK